MVRKVIAPLLLVAGLGVAGLGMAVAPTATAHTPDCVLNGSTSPCQQPSQTSGYISPGDGMQNGTGFGWYLGTPPVTPAFGIT